MNKKIQILRAVAMIAVVVVHNYPVGKSAVIIRPFLNFCVPMFLFLSGYLTRIEIENVRHMYKKRILRVLIPYVIWSVVFTTFYGTWAEFPFHLLTGQCCSIYYYILVYIQLTLLVPLIGKLLCTGYWWVGLALSPVFLGIEYVLLFLGYSVEFPWNVIFFPAFFSYFYLGMMLGNGKHVQKLKSLSPDKGMRLLFFSILLQILEGSFWYLYGNYNMATTQMKFSSMITTMIILILTAHWIEESKGMKAVKCEKIMIYIGDISFGIYLTHLLIMEILSKTIYEIISVPFVLKVILTLGINVGCIWMVRCICGRKISRWLGFH